MDKVRNFIFLGLLLALFVEVLIVFPRQVEREDPSRPAQAEPSSGKSNAKAPAPAHEAEQIMRGVHLVESQKGARDWELVADEAQGGHDQGQWELNRVKVLFFSEERVEFTVTGDRGSIRKSKDMRIQGNVVTTSTNGYVFKTEDIFYDAGQRRMTSPSAVLMQGPKDLDGDGIRLTGQGMDVDVEASRMTIPKNVQGEKALKDGRKVVITSEAVEFSGKSKEIRFSGDVVMAYDRVKLQGPQATFLPSSKGNFMSNIRFTGGVRVSDADKFATSEHLNVDLITSKFVFTGRPKVYQGEDQLSGEEIIFLDGGKKVKVEKVRARMEKAP